MILERAKVENFKCVDDSNFFEIDQVTCLMGKNEAGKTALLEALEKLNPVNEDRKDFEELEYPRRRLVSQRRESNIDSENVLTTEWKLEDEDIEYVEKKLGLNVIKEKSIELKKGYSNERIWSISVDEEKFINHELSRNSLDASERSQIDTENGIGSLISSLKINDSLTGKQQNLYDHLENKISGNSLVTTVAKYLKDKLPKFLYFADYHKMPGRIGLKELKDRNNKNETKFEDRIFLALLQMTSSSLDEIEGLRTTDKLIMELEGIQNSLTDKIFEYWSQNKQLEVEFEFRQSRPGDEFAGAIFDTRIKNKRHGVTVNFNERSAGFTWFFSFLTWFSEVKQNYGDNVFLLLDEPGLSLHGKAQKDLLRYINEELRPHHQVIYTAHSPFMIDTNNIFSLRTVEDVTAEEDGEEVLGTKVGDQIFSRDEDTLFPLQGIVGFDMAQTMFVGPYVIVVEGPSESALLNWFSNELKKRGRTGLDVRWATCPAESASKVSSFVSLFRGRGLEIAALMDFHDGQKGKVRRLEESNLLEKERVFRVTRYVGQEEGDIEDLIGREAYVHLVNKSLKLTGSHRMPNERPDDADKRVVKEAEKHCRTLPARFPQFGHYVPIDYLVSIPEEEVDDIPGIEGSLDRFESLFSDLNSLIE